jgi:hypothetical protein
MLADKKLGVIKNKMSPRIAIMLGMCGASWPYAVSSAFMKYFTGVTISHETVRRVILDEKDQPKELPIEPLDNPPGAVGIDGILIKGRKKGELLEMKVGSFFSNTIELSKNRRQVTDASFVGGSMQKWEDFEERVTKEAFRRGLDCTEEVEFISDGGEGIWTLQETVFPNAKTRLDQYHAKKKVSERTKEGFGKDSLYFEHKDFLLDKLDSGEVVEAIKYLENNMPKEEEQKQSLSKLIKYLKRHETHIPNYIKTKNEGGTVSSGLVEKGNDLIVAMRMKHKIMHWTRTGADPIILRRTHFINRYAKNRTEPYAIAFCKNFNQ